MAAITEEELAAKRAAYIASYTDARVRESTSYGSTHADELSLDDFRAFANHVWQQEGRIEPLIVTAIESLPERISAVFADNAGHAKWSLPPPWFPQLMTAYVDVTVEGRNRLTALHEMAHLLCDTADETRGHGATWAKTFARLIDTHLAPGLGVLWRSDPIGG